MDASHPDVVDDEVEFTDVFEIPRATADEDPNASDELKVRCDLEPNLPEAGAFFSDQVAVALPSSRRDVGGAGPPFDCIEPRRGRTGLDERQIRASQPGRVGAGREHTGLRGVEGGGGR